MKECGRKQHLDADQAKLCISQCCWSRIFFLICVVSSFFFGEVPQVSAQASENESQIIAPTVLSIKSATETGLPIRVITPDKHAFVLIEGLPKVVALSTGRLFESGVWAIKASDLAGLKIVALVNGVEEHNLLFSLKSLEGDVLAQLKSTMRISPILSDHSTAEATKTVSIDLSQAVQTPPLSQRQQNAEIQTAAATPPTEPKLKEPVEREESPQPQALKSDLEPIASSVPDIPEEDMKSIILLMRMGSENMQQGKINIARLFYSRAADKGWAEAAFLLARTYDASELKKIGAIGVQPEPALATKWYRRAAELGSRTAVAYLERLQ